MVISGLGSLFIDWLQTGFNTNFLPCSLNFINAQPREKVMRIKKNMIAKEGMLWSFIKFSQLIL